MFCFNLCTNAEKKLKKIKSRKGVHFVACKAQKSKNPVILPGFFIILSLLCFKVGLFLAFKGQNTTFGVKLCGIPDYGQPF